MEQKKEEKKQTPKENDEIEKFSSEFNKSLDYLQELTKKRKHDQYQKKQKTLKQCQKTFSFLFRKQI